MNAQRWRRGAGVACCLVACSGCASWSYRITAPPSVRDHEVIYLDAVQPIAQRDYQCGPAAVASVLRGWGADVSAETLSEELYAPGTRGIPNFLLAQAARRRGFWTETHVNVSVEDLETWLRAGMPPIVMLRVGPLGIPVYHFVALKGFDQRSGVWYANVGKAETYAIRNRQLQSRWKAAGRWALLICPPERVTWELDDAQTGDLGWLLERTGHLAEAETRYQQALAHRPQDPTLRFDLANVYAKTRRFAEASALYRHLIEEQPGWGPPSNNLAWLELEAGRPREAIVIIEAALAQDAARNYDILDTLGLAYCRVRQPSAGLAQLRTASEHVPPAQHDAQRAIQAHIAACQP